MAVPKTGAIRLRADVAVAFSTVNDGVAISVAGTSAVPTTYHTATASSTSTNIPMSSLLTGYNNWTVYGAKTSALPWPRGNSPFGMPYGTYSFTGTDRNAFSERNSRTILRPNGNYNIKMSDVRGSFLPYSGVIRHVNAGTYKYGLGKGKFWFKVSLIGGGGGGGGGDNQPGGDGGSGSQIDATFYVASDNANQTIWIYVGDGGAGGTGNELGGASNPAARVRAAGGTGYMVGGKGGIKCRSGFSGNGGGGGGSTALVWYPNGEAGTGYLLMQAGGGGGGAGGGKYGPISQLSSGTRTIYGDGLAIGGYAIYNLNKYGVVPTASGQGNTDETFLPNRRYTDDPTNAGGTGAAQPGFDAADNAYGFYTDYYKPYIMDVYGGFYSQLFASRTTTGTGNPSDYEGDGSGATTVTQRNDFFAFMDGGAGGGGGGGGGLPGFNGGFWIGEYVDFSTGSLDKVLHFQQLPYDYTGTGGLCGYSIVRNSITGQAGFEYAWRNIGPRENFIFDQTNTGVGGNLVPTDVGRGPIDRSTLNMNNSFNGYGGLKGTSTSPGSKGNAGGALITFTTADHEGGLYNPSGLF